MSSFNSSVSSRSISDCDVGAPRSSLTDFWVETPRNLIAALKPDAVADGDWEIEGESAIARISSGLIP
jgi:hypothetical protein